MRSIEECLDIILQELLKNWDKPNNERLFLESKDILTKFNLPDTMRKDEFFKRLIFRLVNDGYAEFNTHLLMDRNSHLDQFEKYPLITIEGYYFITKKNGGYAKELETKNAALEMADKRYRWLVCGTWFVGGGAVALVLWEMIKTFWIEPSSH